MRLAFPGSDDVLDANAPDEKCVPNQRPMEAPGNRFGTHQRAALADREFRDPLNVLAELRQLHVIRIAAKREIVPAGVEGIGSRVPQPAKTGKMRITQCFSIELRIVARSWHGSHVKHPHNVIGPKQIDEGIDRPI